MTVIRRLFKIHDSRLHDERNNYLQIKYLRIQLITDYVINISWITVENAFGMLNHCFQIFKKLIPFAPNKVDSFVMT